MGAAASLTSWLDERQPRGGRVKAWVFLTHPGPSLLVTAVAVGAVALVERRAPQMGDLVRTAVLMLSAQLAIGTLNDWADNDRDRAGKPYKPIPRGLVARRAALLLGCSMAALSLATASWWGGGPALAAVLGLLSGLAYDVALKRTPGAVVCWWGGFVALLLLVTSASGAGGWWQTLPLVLLIATSLLVANGIPDAESDKRTGVASLAVLLGERRARQVLAAGLLAAAASVALVAVSGAVGPPAPAAAAPFAGAALAAGAPRRAVFPLTAVLCGLGALLWFAGLPVA